jgi:hypothetical protein
MNKAPRNCSLCRCVKVCNSVSAVTSHKVTAELLHTTNREPSGAKST